MRFRNIVIGSLFAVALAVALFFGITNASKSAAYTPPMDVAEVEQQYHIDIINEDGMSFEPDHGSYVIKAYDEGDTTKVRTYYAKSINGNTVLFVKDIFGYSEILR